MEFTYSLSEIDETAKKILPLLTSKIVVFQGSMGMGKTTFIKALVKNLGIDNITASPTFGLVNHYEGSENVVFHFDFYRIEHQEEAFDIGFEEYLYSGNWCFIEWAERVSSYIPDKHAVLSFERIDENTRKVRVA